MMHFFENLIDGVLVGSIYSMMAIAFTLIFKASEVLNLAQGGLVMLGAYVSYSFVELFGVPFIPAVALTIITCCLVIILLERFPLRPLIGQPVLAIIMATIGIEILIRGVTILIWGAGNWRIYPQIFELKSLNLLGLDLSRQHALIFIASVVILLLLAIFFKKTKIGLLMRATAEGHLVSQSMGINVSKIIGASWVISTIISVFSGIFLGSIMNINVAMSDLVLKALPAAIVGGLESLPGAFIGGILIGVAEHLAEYYIGQGLGAITPFILMMLILVCRPQGLFGLKIIERV
jgi:branched-chain amino acid transport system permease protein